MPASRPGESDDVAARLAAVDAVIPQVQPNTTIGLGSGKAVFALVEAIGAHEELSKVPVVVASPETERRAGAAGLQVVDLNDVEALTLAIDGADEVDHDLNLIKGGGAALLREKLIFEASERIVIICQESKYVPRLGITRSLPVEVIPFGWRSTRRRLLDLIPSVELRTTSSGDAVITAEGHYLLDIAIADIDIREIADHIKTLVGVVEHGLFLDMASEVVMGRSDGTVRTLTRSRTA